MKQLGLAALVLLLAGIGWYALSSGPADPPMGPGRSGGEARAVPVILGEVRAETDDVFIAAVGSGVAQKAVAIHPAVTGEVARVAFEAGRRVAAGDVLVELDSEEERLAVDLARVRVKDATQALGRYQKSAATGAVSASEVDAAASALSEARIALDQAQLALSRRTVLAPFAGVTGLPLAEAGDRVGPDSRLTTLDDREHLYIDFELAEAYAGRIGRGEPVAATTWALPGEVFSGEVAEVGSRIDPVSRSLTVRAAVENRGDLLRPGMSFAISMRLAGPTYASVPEIAVLWDRDGAYVWRVVDGKVGRVPVSVRRRVEGRVLVEAPLSPGAMVVTEGVQRLREGLSVSTGQPRDAAPRQQGGG